jgi:hypothetical protein
MSSVEYVTSIYGRWSNEERNFKSALHYFVFKNKTEALLKEIYTPESKTQ